MDKNNIEFAMERKPDLKDAYQQMLDGCFIFHSKQKNGQ